MSGIEKFLRYKLGYNREILDFEYLEKIAQYERIEVQWISPATDNGDGQLIPGDAGMICWGEKKRLDIPIIFLRSQRDGQREVTPTSWFAFAHELAHFYLQPYLKYIDRADPLELLAEGEPELAELIGYSQMEADQWAVKVLIPDDMLNEHFEDRLVLAMMSTGAWKRIAQIREEVFQFCLKQTENLKKRFKEEGGSSESSSERKKDKIKDLDKFVRRNLMIRSQDYVDEVRRKFILTHKCFPGDNDFHKKCVSKWTLEGLQKQITKIKNVYKNYEEKIGPAYIRHVTDDGNSSSPNLENGGKPEKGEAV